ncbi:MAG: OmpA family [Pseudomonadota bacterium]
MLPKSPLLGSSKTKIFQIERRKSAAFATDDSQTWAVSYADMLMVLMSFFVLFFSTDKKNGQNMLDKVASHLKNDRQLQVSQTAEGKMGIGTQNDGAGNQTEGPAEGGVLLEPGIGSVSFRLLAERAATFSSSDVNSQILSAVDTLMAGIDRSRIEKDSALEKKFQSTKQKIAEVAAVNSATQALEERKGPEIKLSFATQRLFERSNILSKEGSLILAELANYAARLSPKPLIVISAFVSANERETASRAIRLSNGRARVVFETFLEKGIPPETLAMAGYGARKPLLNEIDSFGNTMEKAASGNSRVEIAFRQRRDYRP